MGKPDEGEKANAAYLGFAVVIIDPFKAGDTNNDTTTSASTQVGVGRKFFHTAYDRKGEGICPSSAN
jgi:hypothetical protein